MVRRLLKVAVIGLALAVALGDPLGAQLAYRPTSDTLQYHSLNSYLLYFVQGSDTMGQPTSTRTQELRYFKASGANLQAWVGLRGLDGSTFHSEETYTVTSRGRLLAVNGQPLTKVPNARVDFLPRLPQETKEPHIGDSWADTVGVRGAESYGPTWYRVVRAYKLQRLVDTLGGQVAAIVGSGRMELRQGGWQDSTTGVVWWQEVAGPVADTVLFDMRSGQILSDVSVMNLTGRGAVGPKDSHNTIPSGLYSSVRLLRQASFH